MKKVKYGKGIQVVALAVAATIVTVVKADPPVGPPLSTFTTSGNSKDITLTPGSQTFTPNLSSFSSFISNVHSIVGYGSGTVGTADVMLQPGTIDVSNGDGIPSPYIMVGRNANGEVGTVVYKFVLPSGDVTGNDATINAAVYFRGAPLSMGGNEYIGVNDTLEIDDSSPTSQNIAITNSDDFSKLTMDSVFSTDNYASYYSNNVSLAVPAGLSQFFVVVADDGSSGRFAVSSLTINGDVTSTGSGTPTWAGTQSGEWANGLNWTGGAPNGAGSIAILNAPITTPRTVFTDQAITLGVLQFDTASAGFQVTGQGSLTMAGAGSDAASISVVHGNQKINLPLFFASDTSITVASGATLTIANPVTIMADKTVTESGAITISAPLTLQAGASLVAGAAPLAVFGAPTLGTGAKIDVKSSSMAVDYRGLSDPASSIKTQLAASYAGGSWGGTGLTTSTSTGKTGLGWNDDTANQSVLVKYTYYGDSDLSGTVTTADFATLAGHFGATNATWAQGDFNYDGVVNALDFNAVASNYGQPAITSAPVLGALVPEPASLSLLGIAAASLLRRSRRQH